MKRIIPAIALAAFAVQASAATCAAQSMEKKLTGAAEKSFMKKCEADAKATCEASAKEKKVAGAAQTSFVKKCLADAVGS
jgi:psiF repeat